MAFFFFVPALIALAVVSRVGGATWVLMWPALCYGVISLAYLGLGARVFGKTARGRIPFWSELFFLPYFLPYRGLWHLLLLLRKDKAFNEFAPGFYLGRRTTADALPPHCALVIDLTAEFSESPLVVEGAKGKQASAQPQYLAFPTLDLRPPVDATLQAIAEAAADAGGPVFLHCAQGRGRAATAACAVLLKKRFASDGQDAEDKVRRARPSIRLRRRQRAAVARLAKRWQ